MQPWSLNLNLAGRAPHSFGPQRQASASDQDSGSRGESVLVAASLAPRGLAQGGCRHTLGQQVRPSMMVKWVNSLQKLGVLWVLEILQVAEVSHKLGLLVHLLGGQKIKIGRIRKTLHKLGAC